MNVELLRLLANHIWQSTLFAAAAGLLTLALRKNRARVRQGVWLAASAKFLIPLSVLTLAGEYIPVHTTLKEKYVVLAAAREIGEPFEARATATNPAPAPPESSDLFPALLFGAWISGVACLSYLWITGWLRVRAAVRAGTAVDLGLAIRTVASAAATAPGVFGIFSPTLLLPEGIVKHMTPAQLTAVVTHELCHVRNRDNLAAAFQMAVETIFWFHPLVWWIGKRMIAEREFACDEEVLLMGTEPKAYAEGILQICGLYLESPLPCISGATGANLRKRIERIAANRIGTRMGFARKAVLIAVGSAVVAAPVSVGIIDAPFIRAQSAAPARLRFEVASIKPATNCSASDNIYGALLSRSPGNLALNCATMAGLILGAYSRYANGRTNFSLPPPILGGPPWIYSERYTINAKSAGQENRAMMNGPMLQTLLADRSRLKVHRQIRQVPVFSLTVTRAGARLKPFQEGTCVPVDYAQDPLPQPAGQAPFCQNRIRNTGANLRAMHMPGATVRTFCELLGVMLGRPIIDQTGIKGRFDFYVEFAIDQSTPGFVSGAAPGEAALGVSIFTAVQEQLGLKLQSTKGPGEFLVIDHVEKPSGN
jgi:uncharacterized protein (TIGR03435 family)